MCAPQHLFHAPRQSQVVSNASLGCHFCSIIVASISGCTGCHGREQQPPGGDERPMYISIAMLDPDSGTFLITLFACEQSGVASHDQILNSHTLTLRPIRGMSACPEGAESPGQHQKQQAQEPLALSRLRTSTFSEASAEFIQSWIRECQTTHFLCGSDSLALELLGHGQTLGWPRRLLDLKAFEDQEKIRLIETEGMVPQVEYCALSYSWGLSKLYVLTSATLGDFHREIPLPTLPVLLRDAIQVARRLGFRYLWIDALCIMQDGGTLPAASDDWVDQAGKMSDIFGNATVTIAASECVDGTQNLIRSRNPLGQTICRLDSCAQIPYEVVPPCTPHCLSHSFDRAQYHLDSRAWVFQERILSPRTVHCTRNFIHLECRTELRCEAAWPDGDHCHHQGAVSKADYQSLFMFSACGLGLDGLDELAVDGFLGVWHQLVRRYCRTSLSRRPDFLVALAGLGTRIQQTWELTWSFGLWREHLLRDMLWYVRRGRGAPCRERAPTWSWASIEVRRGEVVHDPATRVSLVAEVTAAPEPSDFARQPSISMMEGEANKYSTTIQNAPFTQTATSQKTWSYTACSWLTSPVDSGNGRRATTRRPQAGRRRWDLS
ncbi:heterokaryon incompatibility protein-domain-containing protein [Emericellopsis atlantica]|uniref:Heterokaryon incompatibility protein-domain-containing protein n=1 Tax=Emericellopsis atlantica TaxID=2614577 RepID=A0A9P7ZHF7_9HYPO|nr:heterokaryon incompatibility protein-domain-containing protein [Emericellopsis atlantica]KAG9251902.1 heterokaryon incompatibility protein-domain-containing protein [Emericellopsis atlantica]